MKNRLFISYVYYERSYEGGAANKKGEAKICFPFLNLWFAAPNAHTPLHDASLATVSTAHLHPLAATNP